MQGSENIEQRAKPKAIPRLIGQVDLRDYFAAKAMQSMFSCQDFVNESISAFQCASREDLRHALANQAYKMADAMLAARAAKEQQDG